MHQLQKIRATILCTYVSLVVLTIAATLKGGAFFLASFLAGITSPVTILVTILFALFPGLELFPGLDRLGWVGVGALWSSGAIANLSIVFLLTRPKTGEGQRIPLSKIVSIVSTQIVSPLVGWFGALLISLPISMHVDQNSDGPLSPGMFVIFGGAALGAFIGLWVGILLSIQSIRGGQSR